MGERFSREGIAKTAQMIRENAARGGTPMTQEQAEARVRRSVRREDRIRSEEG